MLTSKSQNTKARIVQQTIDAMPTPTSKGQTTILWDTNVAGFGVRCTFGGSKAFILNYRHKKRQRRYIIGPCSEMTATKARADALSLKESIRNGGDPQGEREKGRDAKTVAELCAAYMEDEDAGGGNRPSSQRNDRSMIANTIVPKLGKHGLSAITEHDIKKLKDSLEAHPYRGNRTLALLRTMFNYAITKKWTTENPAKNVEMYPEKKRKKKMLTPEQMRKFVAALDSYADKSAASALWLLLLTGAREQEVLGAQWEEFDFDTGVWTKPADRVKTGETEGDQEVALGDEAIAVLESMMPVNPVGPLFPGRDGKKARTTVRRPWVQACKAAELFTKSEVEGKRKNKDGSPKMLTKYKPSMRIHDMRHNIISWLASEGFSLPLIGSIVNQSTEAVTEGYAKIDYAPQRKALNAYGDFIRKCRAGNVIAISTKTGTK